MKCYNVRMPIRRHIAILLTAVAEDDKANGWRAVGGEGSVAPEGWSFPCRGGFIEGVTVLAHGEVRIDARVRAVASSQEFTLGDLPATNVVFSGSNSQWTVFETLDGEEIGWYVNKTSARWDWILSEIESESFQPFWTDSTGPHTIYTVLAHPTAPWEAARSAAQRPWASALDFACQTATGARTANAALTAITQKLFSNMGFSYETCSGAPNYRVPQKGKLVIPLVRLDERVQNESARKREERHDLQSGREDRERDMRDVAGPRVLGKDRYARENPQQEKQ